MIQVERATSVDWSSFAPDLIVGLLTGVVVGAVLWWWTAVSHRRNAQEITVRDWAILKAKLSSGLRRPHPQGYESFAELGPAADRLYELVSGCPLRLWYSITPVPGIAEAVAFQDAYEAASATGHTVENNLVSAIHQQHIYGKDADIIARLIRLEFEYGRPGRTVDVTYSARQIGMSEPDVVALLSRMEAAMNWFKDSIYLDEYLECRAETNAAVSKLLDSLLEAGPTNLWLKTYRHRRNGRRAVPRLGEPVVYNPR
jgi:DNA-binding MarR family transcriptional regulator